MADDNVHWLRDTYGPALRAFYADLVKQPVPQRFVDLIANLEATSPPTQADAAPAAAQQREPQPDASE